MKKELVLILILLFLGNFKSYSQIKNLEINYGVSYNVSAEDRIVDKEKLLKDHPDIYEEVINTDSQVSKIDFRLKYDGKNAIMYGNEPKEENLINVFNDFEGKDTLFSNLVNNEILIYKHDYWGVNLLINYNYSKYNWEITNETKLIDNIICYKAVMFYQTEDAKNEYKFKVTAWYNPQINVSIGPKGFGGLPGLIYELDDGFRTFYIKEIKINKGDFKIQFETNKKRTKNIDLETFRKTYDEIKREYKQMIMRN